MTTGPDAKSVEYASAATFEETLERLRKAIEHAGMTLFATIDHAAGARSAGMQMPPTVVLIYGSPKGGTPLMLAAPSVALDLPLRALLREEDGRVLVSFHPMAPILRHAGLDETLATRLDPAQLLLVDALQSGTPST